MPKDIQEGQVLSCSGYWQNLSAMAKASSYGLQDLMRIDSTRARDFRLTIVEGMQILGSFDVRLREYAAKKLHNQGVSLVKVPSLLAPSLLSSFEQICSEGCVIAIPLMSKHGCQDGECVALKDMVSEDGLLWQSMVKEVRETELVLQNGETLPYGICVW